MKKYLLGIIFFTTIGISTGYLLFSGRVKEVIITKTNTRIDTVIVEDTIKVIIPKKIYIKEYVPVIQDCTAILDTIIDIPEKDIGYKNVKIRTSLGIKFDLRLQKFTDISLGFPLLEFPKDTVFINKTLKLTEQVNKPMTFKLIQAGVIGAAIGFVVYSIVQGI